MRIQHFFFDLHNTLKSVFNIEDEMETDSIVSWNIMIFFLQQHSCCGLKTLLFSIMLTVQFMLLKQEKIWTFFLHSKCIFVPTCAVNVIVFDNGFEIKLHS